MSGSDGNDDDLGRRLEVATRAARAGGALALDYFRRRDTLAVEHKGKQDLVSRADTALYAAKARGGDRVEVDRGA